VKPLFALLFILSFGARAQMTLDEKGLNTIVYQWNYANNSRSEKTFSDVYADTLLYYTQTLPKARCIRLKKALFNSYPDFRQRIISRIKYTAFSDGLIKADFVKEIIRDSVRKHYSSYLLLDYNAGRYKVAGESDVATDKTRNYMLRIGTPLNLDSAAADTATASTFKSATANVAVTKTEFPESLLEGEVTVSKKYVMLLVGILLLGGLLILLAPDRSRAKKTGLSVRETEMAEPLEQLAFKKFVQTLFDPLYFLLRDTKPLGPSLERYHLMHGIFRDKERVAEFDVLCVYYPSASDFMKNFESIVNDIRSARQEMYIVVGMKNTGDNPGEVYLIPVQQLLSQTKQSIDLSRFKKWGMFFYSREANRLL
jgi:hypothetical protein